MSSDLRRLSYQTLLCGAREASPSVRYDGLGYATRWEENLAEGLPFAPIISDLSAGAGSELNGKLRAAPSSAALVVNTFGPWRTTPTTLQIGEIRGFSGLKFEATCPIGLGGTPPHLDLIAEEEVPVAIESKCTEWMEFKAAKFLHPTTDSTCPTATPPGLNRFDICATSRANIHFLIQHNW